MGDQQMHKFKIVFLDGKIIKLKALNFSAACASAAYSRVKSGEASVRQLFINEKACSVVTPMKTKIREGNEKTIRG
jgi:hypothetical protein